VSDNYLSSANFDLFVERDGLSIIVFTAAWCAPCKDLKKVLAELQQEFAYLQLAYVDIESEPELVASFAVKSVPFVMVVRDAVVLFADSGSQTLQTMRELVLQAMQLDMDEVRDQG
jgi:thioredoxin 1